MNHQAPNHPIISIVTPSCNQGAFLAETIENIISQVGKFSKSYSQR